MKRFSFPLDRVLEFRRQIQELESGKLQALAAQRGRLLDRAGEIHQQARFIRAESVSCRTAFAGELQHAHEYVQALGRARETALAQADSVERQRKQQMTVVIEARRNTRLLELLRAKRLRRHAAMAAREQEALAGELFLAARAKKKL